jgi:large subunit ribosomal protein L6
MSRIGKRPVEILGGVKVTVSDRLVHVEGPKGKLEYTHPSGIAVAVAGSSVVVTRPNDERQSRALHGLTRSLIQNMVTGVSKGYETSLDITGTGYRAELAGDKLTIAAGLSRPVVHRLPKGVTAEIAEKQTRIILRCIDKQLLGIQAATIRHYRPPEPYKGKGIRYTKEQIRRTVGKSGAA